MIPGKRFIQNVSASTLQLVTNQVMGLIIFYVLSKEMDKASFGNLNWALAVLLAFFGILSCGIDQLVVKKIASGEGMFPVLPLYIAHVCVTGILFYSMLLISYLLFPSGTIQYLLLFLAIGKLCAFFSTPFKQFCAGLERFRLLLCMSVGSSLSRALLLLLLYSIDRLSLKNIMAVFITGDFIELVITLVLSRKYLKAPLRPRFDMVAYRRLFKEALPQLGTVVLAAVMTRLDWILIGIFLSAERLAEYSFAYKVYELSTFPLLIIAPLLIPWFSKVFRDNQVDEATIKSMKALLSIELMIASLTSMILVIAWVPVIDFITGGKYGSVNRNTVFILSLCISFLYFNNFLWTILFSCSRLKEIFRIFIATFAVNAAGDIILIPLFHNEGAAAACLLSLMMQSVLFIRTTKISGLNRLHSSLLVYPVCALVSGFVSVYFFTSAIAVLASAVCIYLTAVLLSLGIREPYYKLVKNLKKG